VREWPEVDVTATAKLVDPQVKPPAAGPVVTYRHEVGGNVYRTTLVSAPSEAWAPAGPKLVTDAEASYARRGHYDPERPHELFLPRPLGFGDYWAFFFWGPLLGVGVGGLALRKPGRSATSSMDPAGERGWYRLRPKYSIRRRAIGTWIVVLVSCTIISVAAVDYFTGRPRTHTTASNVLVCVGLLPGLAVIAVAAHYTWLAQRVTEARVAIHAARVTPGSRLAARVELPVKAGVEIEQVVVSLACIRTAVEGGRVGFRKTVIWEERSERDVSRRVRAGGRVTFEERFTLPEDAAPASASGAFGPWIDWEIRVEFRLADGPDYRGKFQVLVEAAGPV
jgi:hypothetical protein